MARLTDFENAVNWFFNGGYKTLSRNPNSSKQSQISSAASYLNKAANFLEMSQAEVLLIAFKKRKRKTR